MSSANGNKSVRFAQGTGTGDTNGGGGGEGVRGRAQAQPSAIAVDHRRPLKKRKLEDRTLLRNEDELDDVDDWQPGEDGEDGHDAVPVPSERELLEAKRERRIKRTVEDDDREDTRIDNRTSLAAEGIEVEPFTMEQESTDGTGYFDGDTYVFRKRDEAEEPDAWLEGLDDAKDNNQEDFRSRIAMVREDERRRQEAEDADQRMDNWTEEDLYAKLLPNLAAGETVMEALIRYGNLFRQQKRGKGNSAAYSTTTTSTVSPESRQVAHDSFNDLTEASNALLLKGKIDIYQMKRDDIEALLPKPPEPTPTPTTTSAVNTTITASHNTTVDGVQWEYQGMHDGQIHGPYSSQEMLRWTEAGYFVGATAVNVRTVQPAAAPDQQEASVLQEELLSDLMDDDDEGEDRREKKEPNAVRQVPRRGEWMLSDTVDFRQYVIK